MNIEALENFPNKIDLITEFSPIVREKIEEERKAGTFHAFFFFIFDFHFLKTYANYVYL